MSAIIWILAIAIVLLAAFLCGRACDNLAQYKGYGGSAFWVGFFEMASFEQIANSFSRINSAAFE